MIGAEFLTIETDPISHKAESHYSEATVSGKAVRDEGKGTEKKWQSSSSIGMSSILGLTEPFWKLQYPRTMRNQRVYRRRRIAVK